MNQREDRLFTDIVSRFAEESKCCKIKVASLAVRDKSPLCVGINGTAPGMENCKDHFYKKYLEENKLPKDARNYYDFSRSIAKWNNYDPNILEHFYRDFLEEHHKWSYIHELHAEQNLIARCLKQKISLEGATIYQTHFTCPECARLLSRTGIKELVYINDYDRQNNESLEILQSQKIVVRQYREE